MAGFVKLDTGVLNSSLWIERDLRSVFITALVMATPHELKEPTPQIAVRSLDLTGWVVPPGWYGFVPAAGTGIVRRDGMEDIDAGLDLLEKLCSPDPDSRSQNYEGRRMARIDHGYVVLNFFEFRDRDYTAAERMRRLRARRKGEAKSVTGTETVGNGVTANVTPTEDREQRTENISSAADLTDQDRLLEGLPTGVMRRAWAAEMDAARQGLHGPALTTDQINQACRDYVGNGHLADAPSLRHFRAFLRNAGKAPQVFTASPRRQGKTEAGRQALAGWVNGDEPGGGGGD